MQYLQNMKIEPWKESSMEESILVKNVTKIFNLSKPLHEKTEGVENVYAHTKKNRQIIALDDVSFSVSKGEVLGILGLNGSGKTTLLRILSGIYLPDRGFVKTNGKLAPLLQLGTGFHKELVASENIIMYGMLLGFSKDEIKKRVPKIIEFAELEQFSSMPLKQYSSGMRARLAFSTGFQIDPDILIIDEILSVGDIKFRAKGLDAILSLKKNNKTIILASHSMNMIAKICDRALILQQGKLIGMGDTTTMIKKYKEIANIHQKNEGK